MAPPYLSTFYLAVPPFAVPVIIRNGTRSIYTAVPFLALLALLSGGFGLVEYPRVQALLETLLAATLGASVLHLQGLANAPVPMLATNTLFLICATLLSFSPRLSQVSPILFLIFIIVTLVTSAFLFLARRRPQYSVPLTLTPVPPSPTPSHMSFQYTNSPIEKPPPAILRSQSELDLSPRRRSQYIPPTPSSRTEFVLLLSIQLLYAVATAFCIPTAFRSSDPALLPLISLVATSPNHVAISTYIFSVFVIVFRIITLLLVFGAYYCCSGRLTLNGKRQGSTCAPNRSQRCPNTGILCIPTSPTTMRLHSIIHPSSRTSTSTSPIKLGFFKSKHKRAGPSSSSSFFSPRPKRMPLVPTTTPHLDLQPEYTLHELDFEPISPCPSSRASPEPVSPARETKERFLLADADAFADAVPPPSSVLVRVATPMPVFYKESAWSSLSHSVPARKAARDAGDNEVLDDGDCTDLKDPFACGTVRASVAPSAYRRWAESVECSSDEARRRSENEAVHPRTRMSTWGHLPLHQHKPRQGRLAAPSLRIDTTVCAST